MIAIDTNVLVRILTRDQEEQFQKASTLFSKHDIFIPETVILETEWVLRYSYNFTAAAICDAFAKTFGLANVKIHRPDLIAQAINLSRQGLDFADALHLSSSRECKQFVTFDTAFIRNAKGLTKCKVTKP